MDSKRSKQVDQPSSQSSDSQPITLLDVEDDDDEDVPIAKLTRSYKKQDAKGKNKARQTAEKDVHDGGAVGTSSGVGKSARRLTKSIKQE